MNGANRISCRWLGVLLKWLHVLSFHGLCIFFCTQSSIFALHSAADVIIFLSLSLTQMSIPPWSQTTESAMGRGQWWKERLFR